MEAAAARAGRRPLDWALEMSGSEQALTAACRLVSPGGWISLLGISDAPETVDLTRDARPGRSDDFRAGCASHRYA